MADDKVIRVTLFVPGPAALANVKLAGEVETEWIENDGEFGAAFSYGTCDPALVKQIDKAPGALLMKWEVDLHRRKDIVADVKKLADAGGLAVRLEQSKLGWAIDQWMTVFIKDDVVAWHRTAIVFLGGKGYLQSCGMHAWSLPDVRIGVDGNAAEMQRLATVLNLYQIDDDPVIRSGQTFAPDKNTPKRLVERWPDTGYPPGHACHNPYGVWHVGPPGGKARDMGELQPVHMPSLLSVLTALEKQAGKKLTQRQVEKVRDEGVCVAMNPRDIQQLERSRGWSDLDPELVWEQWTAYRDSRNS